VARACMFVVKCSIKITFIHLCSHIPEGNLWMAEIMFTSEPTQVHQPDVACSLCATRIKAWVADIKGKVYGWALDPCILLSAGIRLKIDCSVGFSQWRNANRCHATWWQQRAYLTLQQRCGNQNVRL
jgi:hypothetical protein